jgi:predicted enzyme related to lactoylglutathione lyase
MLNFNQVMIGSAHPDLLAEFYEKVFGKEPDWSEENWYGWQMSDTHLTIGEHSEVKAEAKEPQRIILNFETNEVQEEFERLKALGAKVIKEPYEMGGAWIATFADPDGNYFQLMSPWDPETN